MRWGRKMAGKGAFGLAWDQFTRDGPGRWLAVLQRRGPFEAIVTVTRGGPGWAGPRSWARGISKTFGSIEDGSVFSSYETTSAGARVKVLKGVAAELVQKMAAAGGGVLIVDDLSDHRQDRRRVVRGGGRDPAAENAGISPRSMRGPWDWPLVRTLFTEVQGPPGSLSMGDFRPRLPTADSPEAK